VTARDDVVFRLRLHQILGHVYRAQGRLRREAEELEQGLVLAREIHYEPYLRQLHSSLSWTCARLGELERSEKQWTTAGAWDGARKALSFTWLTGMANLFSRSGRSARALEFLEMALEGRPAIESHQQKDIFNAYVHELGRIERVLHRAGRRAEFPDFCRRAQEREAAHGASLRGVWWPAPARIEREEWDETGGCSYARGHGWKWEDPYEVCGYSVAGEGVCIQVEGVLGFNALNMPRLLRRVEGDFAVEVEVAPVEDFQAALADRLARVRADDVDRELPMPGASGLLVRAENGDAVRLIAHIQEGGEVIFDMRRGEDRIAHGHAWIPAGPVRLRLERQSNRFKAYCHGLERGWLGCGEAEVPLGWKVRAGICAEVPVMFYDFTRRGEARSTAIRFFRPRVVQERVIRQEEAMLSELREALTETEGSLGRFEERLLRALGTSVEADWGQYLGVDGQGKWVERCRWAAAGEQMPDPLPALPSRIGDRVSIADTHGNVVCIPLVDGQSRSGGWILGRKKPLTTGERDLLGNAGVVAGALLENEQRREEEQRRQVHPPRESAQPARFPGIVGHSAAMQQIFDRIEGVASGAASVLIQGESGTGKEPIARAIHNNSPRSDRQLVVQNCAALPDSLLESELFGHCRGAFTGATADKPGLFEVADGGTIFLDEIADASPGVQAKLLRAVEEGEIRRVGETKNRKVNVRIISAASRDLAEQVRRGRLREDLYYRLNVVRVSLPPLRERREDIPLLAEFLRERICARDGREIPGFTRGAMDLLCAYPWPGNVRELQNEIERGAASVRPGKPIAAEDLSRAVRGIGSAEGTKTGGSLQQMVEHVERTAICQAVERCAGNISQVARELGLSRSGLHKKMKRYGLGR